MLQGRSQLFLVGWTPNQDAQDTNTHLERLYNAYLSVWEALGGSRDLYMPLYDPGTPCEHALWRVIYWHVEVPRPP